MLQIVTGKFFTTEHRFETLHRGTFYTNYRTLGEDAVVTTSLGRLLPAAGFGGLGAFNYELVEKIEGVKAAGALISTGGVELAADFAAVVAFVLNIICSPDPDLVRRLTAATSPEMEERHHPRKYLRRVFDARLMMDPEDGRRVGEFLTALVGLKRTAYEGTIRAVRRYVMATHRIADEIDLAYALFVMSIESLAQSSRPSTATWSDYDEGKRHEIDKALKAASDDVKERVRAAVLKNEHVSVARKFRAFAMEHIAPSFFRDEAGGATRAICRPDLECLLGRAYGARSGYVHRLNALPKLLLPPFDLGETMEIEGSPTLTFEGLARLSRHVIFQFVERAPKVEREPFDWFSALPNLLRMPLAVQHWIGDSGQYKARTARLWLQGLLAQASTAMMNPGNGVTDIGAILDKIETLALDNTSLKERRPILALYHLFTRMAATQQVRPRHDELMARYQADFAIPSIEELAVRLVTRDDLPWSLGEQEALHKAYYLSRHGKEALRLGQLLEAVFTLRLAEAYREAGDEARARALIVFAFEAFPSHAALRSFEANLGNEKLAPVRAYEILLPLASSNP